MKKISLLALVLCSLVSSFAFGAGGDMGAGTEPLTDGSAAYPYLIEDFADFQVFASNSSYWASGINTKLMTDIDLNPALSGRQTYTTAVIAPAGGSFAGTFDGNGHVISNLGIDGSGTGNIILPENWAHD